jgi:hypothetical protein
VCNGYTLSAAHDHPLPTVVRPRRTDSVITSTSTPKSTPPNTITAALPGELEQHLLELPPGFHSDLASSIRQVTAAVADRAGRTAAAG